MMEAVRTSERSVYLNETTWAISHLQPSEPENSLPSYCLQYLKVHKGRMCNTDRHVVATINDDDDDDHVDGMRLRL